MINFDIITIFPDFFNSFLSESIIKKAQEKNLISINIHNLRDFTKDKHKTVDDKPFGGGEGMVMKVEPIYRAIKKLRRSKIESRKSKVVLFTPRGKKFNQKLAFSFSKLDQLILICGRYEGIDERVAENLVDEKISIGDFVLMGGEIPAMAVIESVSRLIPGVAGNKELLKRITKKKGFLEFPQYTRPEVFKPEKGKKWSVPKILLSGHHKKIKQWREKKSREIS